jgi:hypothetical protein
MFDGMYWSYETCGAANGFSATASSTIGILYDLLATRVLHFMEQPIQMINFALPFFELEYVNLSGEGFQYEVEAFLFSQILPFNDYRTHLGMVYIGLESGLFTGYSSKNSYTVRAATGLASDVPWAPYELASFNSACASSDTCDDMPGKMVSIYCVPTTAGQTGMVEERSCNVNGCCDANIRTYYKTSLGARGRPINVTGWRMYDPRERVWYTLAKEQWETFDVALAYTGLYEFATSGSVGITATGALIVDGIFRGVYGIDYDISVISTMLSSAMDGHGTGRWAYIVQRAGDAMGKVIASTFDETKIQESALHTEQPSIITESAFILQPLGWVEGFFQRLEVVASASTKYHECYLKRGYDNCSVPLVEQYVQWSSDNAVEKRAAGPARCNDGSRSCILESHDFGGNIGDCGYAPVLAIAVNSLEWKPPSWFSGPLIVDTALEGPEMCQDICSNDVVGCEFFSYEWEDFTSFEFMTKFLPGQNGFLDWLIVVGQNVHCDSAFDIWRDGRCVTCSSGLEPNAQMDRCVVCPPGMAGLDGFCRRCSAGSKPNAASTQCEKCPQLQITMDHQSCIECPMFQIPTPTGDACQCKPNYFNSTTIRPQCFESEFVGSAASSSLFECIECDGLKCIEACGSDWIKVTKGWAPLTQGLNGAVSVFTCKTDFACPGGIVISERSCQRIKLANENCSAIAPTTENLIFKCSVGFTGKLCGICVDGYQSNSDGTCTDCGGTTWGVLALVILVVILLAFWKGKVLMNYLALLEAFAEVHDKFNVKQISKIMTVRMREIFPFLARRIVMSNLFSCHNIELPVYCIENHFILKSQAALADTWGPLPGGISNNLQYYGGPWHHHA